MANWYSISDDDICSNCAHLRYYPGDTSTCTITGYEWPAEFNADGYAVSCPYHTPCRDGENWAPEIAID